MLPIYTAAAVVVIIAVVVHKYIPGTTAVRIYIQKQMSTFYFLIRAHRDRGIVCVLSFVYGLLAVVVVVVVVVVVQIHTRYYYSSTYNQQMSIFFS